MLDYWRAMGAAALGAGRALIRMQREAVLLHSEKDILSDADLLADEIIRSELSRYDGIAYLSEENTTSGSGKLAWIVDPLDGTVNYLHSENFWGVSIALAIGTDVEQAILHQPSNGTMFIMDKQEGLLFSTESAVVSQSEDLSKCRVWTDWVKGNDSRVAPLLDVLGSASLYPCIRGCVSLSLAAVATGRADGYICLQPEMFDFAAGALLVELSGGRVTNVDGEPWSIESRSIIASNGLIHDELIETVKGLE